MALIDFFKRRGGNPVDPPRDIRLHNTRTGKKELFTPQSHSPNTVRMYNCGPTVYSQAHIGNLRAYVFADTLRRVFAQAGFTVEQVVNITDVGHLVSDADDGADKMEEGAKRLGLTAREVAAKYTALFLDDIAALNVETEDVFFPRATDHIPDQIALIKTLEEKGYTYRTSDGIYFDTSKFPAYGALGGIDLAGLKEGARVEKNEEKKHPTDFALWKFSVPADKRQQEWQSPWGVGFPGWHIECSAMSMRYLGKTLDVHTGGIDHIPVHHNNEIAQSEAATGKTFAHYWLHVAFLMVEGRKISKSLGNTITVAQLVDRGLSPLAYRLFLLSGHYRTPMNFTWEAVEGAHAALFRLRKLFVEKLGNAPDAPADPAALQRFRERMNDDLDTPRAVSILWEVVRNETMPAATKRATLLAMDHWLGLGLDESNEAIREMLNEPISPAELPDAVKQLVADRDTARKEKRWKDADALRTDIEAAGFTVTDEASGAVIRKKQQ